MFVFVPPESVVDVLTFCFALNLSFTFPKVIKFFENHFFSGDYDEYIDHLISEAELPTKAAQTLSRSTKLFYLEYLGATENLSKVARVLSIYWAILCGLAIYANGWIYIKYLGWGHLFFICPILIFLLFISCMWAIFRICSWTKSFKYKKVAELKKKAQQNINDAEDLLKTEEDKLREKLVKRRKKIIAKRKSQQKSKLIKYLPEKK